MDEEYLIIKNPDEAFRKDVLRRIGENNGYCPCRFERTPDTKCHCKEFRETGECICGLFIKVLCREVKENEYARDSRIS